MKFTESLRFKILVVALGIFFLASAVQGVSSYIVGKNLITEQIVNQGQSLAESTATQLDIWFAFKIRELQIIAQIDGIREMNENSALYILSSEMEVVSDDFENMFIVWLDGSGITDSGQKVDLSYRDYIQKALSGEAVIASPVISAITSNVVVPVAVPIYRDGIQVGVLGGSVKTDKLADLVDDITLGQTGYAYVIDHEGTAVAHPDPSIVLNMNIFELGDVMAAVGKNMLSGQVGTDRYVFRDVDTYASYATIPSTGWAVAVKVPVAQVSEPLNALLSTSSIVILIILAIMFVIIFFGSKLITDKLAFFSKHADTMAKGDFTQEIPESYLMIKDETGVMARALNQMTYSLRAMINEITEKSNELSTSSEELSSAGANIASTMEEVSASTEEIAAGMEEVSASTEEINASGEEIGSMLNALSQEAEKGNEESKGIGEKALKIYQGAEKAKTNILSISEDINSKVNKAIEEAKVVEQISSLAQSIAGIADQTNLLALNAAIEAARAGEHGRGFAVVAEEVRKLAEDSSQTVSNIQTLTKQVELSINNLIENSQGILEFINKDVIKDYDFMAQTGLQYKNDSDRFYEITNLFLTDIETISNSMNEINSAIEQTSATIEQSTAGSQEIAKGSQNASIAAQEINNISEKLAEGAEILNELVKRFKV